MYPTHLTECVSAAGNLKLDAVLGGFKADLFYPDYRYGSTKVQKTICHPKNANAADIIKSSPIKERIHSLQLKNNCYICTVGRKKSAK